MKILAITEDTPCVAGGRISFFKICRALARKHHVEILTCSGTTERILGRWKIERRMPFPPTASHTLVYFTFFVWASLKTLYSIRRFDILFVNSGIMVFPALLISKIVKKRIVVLQHDSFFLDEVIMPSSKLHEKITAALSWFLSYPPLKFVDLVFTVSVVTAMNIQAERKVVLGNIVGGYEYGY